MLPKNVADHIDRFTGRIWLLPELLKWLDDSAERVAGPIQSSNWQANNVYSFSQCLAEIFGPKTQEDRSGPHFDDATVCTDWSEKALVRDWYWAEGFWPDAEPYYRWDPRSTRSARRSGSTGRIALVG